MKNINTNYPVEQRNAQLLNFFEVKGYTNVKVLGNPNQPKIIIDDEFAISGFVKNRIYNFTTKPFGGEVILSVNLNNPSDYSPQAISDVIESSEKRKIYFCELDTVHKMYISHTRGGHVYYSSTDPRVFFNLEDAESFADHIENNYSISCDIICPTENI